MQETHLHFHDCLLFCQPACGVLSRRRLGSGIMFGAACEADARQLWGREGHGCRRKACGDNGHDVGEARHGDAERFDRHRCESLRRSFSIGTVCFVWIKALCATSPGWCESRLLNCIGYCCQCRRHNFQKLDGRRTVRHRHLFALPMRYELIEISIQQCTTSCDNMTLNGATHICTALGPTAAKLAPHTSHNQSSSLSCRGVVCIVQH